MATPYIKKPFSINSGATASGDIYVDELSASIASHAFRSSAH